MLPPRRKTVNHATCRMAGDGSGRPGLAARGRCKDAGAEVLAVHANRPRDRLLLGRARRRLARLRRPAHEGERRRGRDRGGNRGLLRSTAQPAWSLPLRPSRTPAAPRREPSVARRAGLRDRHARAPAGQADRPPRRARVPHRLRRRPRARRSPGLGGAERLRRRLRHRQWSCTSARARSAPGERRAATVNVWLLAATVLLAALVLPFSVLVCCVGIVAARDAFARLHYSAAASTLGPVLVAIAIAVEEGVRSTAAAAALVVAVFLLLGNPAVTIATARAARARRER